MITEQALQEAIAECQGKRDPNRDDCMMLAAFYIIQDRLYPKENDANVEKNFTNAYSFAPPPTENLQQTAAPEVVGEYGDSDFLRAVAGKKPDAVWAVIDQLMDDLSVINPRVYAGVMRKIK